jgi:SAM-dependent methyltransferase
MSPATGLTLVLVLVLPASAPAQQAGGARDVGFVATPMSLVEGMLDLAAVGEGDLVYDLGSGDGRIVIAAARRGARGVGIELDSVLVEESRASADTAGVGGRTEFRQADLFATDFSPATVVTLYLGRELNQRLRPVFLRELRPGTRVVSQAFDMGDWTPDTVVTVRSREVAATPIHLWVVPATVAGHWTLAVDAREGPERLRLDLGQRYQQVRGTATSGSARMPLERGWLRGDSLAFTVGERAFVGQVTGDSARGTVRGPDGTLRPWRAGRS